MRIGVPKEIKNHEYRVGLTPPSVAELVAADRKVNDLPQGGIAEVGFLTNESVFDPARLPARLAVVGGGV